MENLLNLPDEILTKILRFLPNRFLYAPVCKRFYELICDIERFKYKLVIGCEKNRVFDRTTLMNTRRVFDTLDVSIDVKRTGDASLLRNIYRKHGKTVKNLWWNFWSGYKYKEDDVIEMLNFMPNLENLELKSWYAEFVKSTLKKKKTLNLTKLKSVSFEDCEDFSIEFITRILPENVLKQLKTLPMLVPTEIFQNMFEKHPSIECLDIAGYYTDASPFHTLKLKQLGYNGGRYAEESILQAFLKSLILSQPNLTVLDTSSVDSFGSEFIDDELFEEIVKLSQLTYLKLNIDLISPDAIGNIVKLEKLKSLSIQLVH